MRLCFIGPAHSIHTQRWLQAFVDRGHQVHLVTLPGESVTLDRVTVHPLPDGPAKVRFARWALSLRRILAGIRPDVLHAHYLTRYGWLAGASGLRPLVVSAWGTDAYIDPERSRLSRILTGRLLRRADHIIADAENLAERLVALGAPRTRLSVIQWGVDVEQFRPDRDTAALRAQLNLGPGPIILSTRGLMPNYNQDTILHAMPSVLAAAPQARLVIKYNTCDPDYRDDIYRLVDGLDLAETVRFVTATPYHEMATYYALAQVFVSVASSDSTPVSLLEAMACGAVPVMGDLAAIREWITDRENGYLVPPRDPASLAAALVAALTSDTWRSQVRATNRQIIEARADHQHEMSRVEALYAGLARSQQAR
jgi:glycosyltransferase involved in cell wall biosynthesis